MIKEDAFVLLFEKDFGGDVLFKNQFDLVRCLISDARSPYYVTKLSPDFDKSISRLKTYVSQLLSNEKNRNVTFEFRKALELVLASKLNDRNVDFREISDAIIADLREKNSSQRQNFDLVSFANKTSSDTGSIISALKNSNYLSIFTSREFTLQVGLAEKDGIITLLLGDLLKTIFSKRAKFYRLNFPSEQLCLLFWKALRKQLSKQLKESLNHDLEAQLFMIYGIPNKKSGLKIDESSLGEIVSQIIRDAVERHVLRVFCLHTPVFSLPFIALDPNDQALAKVLYICQLEPGTDVAHPMTKDEFFYWKMFVWDNLRINNHGKEIPPQF